MIQRLRSFILDAGEPFTRWVGKAHLPFTKRLLTESAARSAAMKMQPGDVLVTSIRGEPSNIFIPGEFTHAAMWAPANTDKPVIEAVSPVCKRTGLYDFFMTKDRICVVRARRSSAIQRMCAAEEMATFIGLEYDFDMILEDDDKLQGAKRVYCAEAAYTAHKRSNADLGFMARKFWGRFTIVPQAFLDDKESWELIWDSATFTAPS